MGAIIVIGAFAYTNTMRAIAMQNSYMNDINPHIQIVRDIRRDVNLESIAANELAHLLIGSESGSNSDEIKQIADSFEELKESALLNFEIYSTTVDSKFPDEIPFRDSIMEKMSSHHVRADELIAAAKRVPASTESQILGYQQDFEQSRIVLLAALEDPLKHNQLKLENVKIELESLGQSTLTVTLFFIIASASTTMLGGFYLHKSIGDRLGLLTRAVDAVRKGTIEPFPPLHKFRNNKDEISILSKHFEEMKAELRDKEKLKEEFISIASHELRTPIQPILSFAELGKKGLVKPGVAFDEIYKQAMRLKDLANDILDTSKIESGNLILTTELVSLNDIIRVLINEKKVSLRDSVKLELSLTDDRYATVYADKSRLIQVVSNLLNNAIKFTKEGAICISTSFKTGGYGKKLVEITINDSGTGIPQEIYQRLFTKFASQSVDLGTERGTGLGLYVSKSIVEAHKGSISASNNANGKGATFTILLPYEDARTVPNDSAIQLSPA